MNAVGIDVSKGKSMVTIMRPLGEIVVSPYEVNHTDIEINKLADLLEGLSGEVKVIMECTGNYHLPIAYALYERGLTVCTLNPQFIHNYGNNSIRNVKTDKADVIKITNYGLSHWLSLPVYVPEEDIRRILKAYNRQYTKYIKLKTTLKNNLISLLDQYFPDINTFFKSPPRKSDGHEKWIDFAKAFWHCECVSTITPKKFEERYRKWCSRFGYNFSKTKAQDIYFQSAGHFHVLPKTLDFS